MNAVREINRIRLQRLVDGELDLVERAALLEELDREPSLWRNVALAFVEDQVITTEVRADQTSIATVSIAKPVRIDTKPFAVAESKPSWRTLLSLAASILLVLAGFAIGNRIGQNTRHANATPIIPPTTPNVDSRLAAVDNSLPIKGKIQIDDSEFPIYGVSPLEERLYGQENENRVKIENLLRRYGFDLEVEDELFNGQLPDGRKVVVPVRNVGLRSIGL